MTTLMPGNLGLNSWTGHLTLCDLEHVAYLLCLRPLICKMGRTSCVGAGGLNVMLHQVGRSSAVLAMTISKPWS